MKWIKNGLITIAALLFISALAILRPVPIVPEAECHVVSGILKRIHEGGDYDIGFQLANNPVYYYINRGLEQGLTLEGLQNVLVGREIVMKYPDYWTPLDWNNRVRHISKLEFDGETIWTELHE